MIKLKKLLKESSPGFTKREFGDPLPTFKDVMEKHQQQISSQNHSLSARQQLKILITKLAFRLALCRQKRIVNIWF